MKFAVLCTDSDKPTRELWEISEKSGEAVKIGIIQQYYFPNWSADAMKKKAVIDESLGEYRWGFNPDTLVAISDRYELDLRECYLNLMPTQETADEVMVKLQNYMDKNYVKR